MANQLSICIDVLDILLSLSIDIYIYIFIYVFVRVEVFFPLPANIKELIVFATVCNEVILFYNININNSMQKYFGFSTRFCICSIPFSFVILFEIK